MSDQCKYTYPDGTRCDKTRPNVYNSTIRSQFCPQHTYEKAMHPKAKKSDKTASKGVKRAAPVAWRDKSKSDMIVYVQGNIINPYIRARDNECYGGKSISDNGKISDAGHYYSVGAKAGLRFCIQNIHGQSKSGNSHLFKGGDLINYRIGLVNRYGEDYVKELDHLAMISEGPGCLDLYNVIYITETYLYLMKNKIWVFRDEEFQKYKMQLINKVLVI